MGRTCSLRAKFFRCIATQEQIKRVSIDAGHCPHDEAPVAVNAAILGFAAEVF